MIPTALVGVLLVVCGVVAGVAWMTHTPGRYRPERFHRPSDPPGSALRDRLGTVLRILACDIGERNLSRPGSLERTATFVESRLRDDYDEVRRQRFTVDETPLHNLEVRRLARGDSAGVWVVGAHYDTVAGSPGANDNGTGVAALLELAGRFAGRDPRCEVRFVAFVNEEPPYFGGERMGSVRYARRCARRGVRILGMWSLETIGFYSDEPGSQRYPLPFGWVYPDRGEFLAFVTNLSGRSLMHRSLGAFRERGVLPAQGVSAPPGVPGVGWSDHGSFWKHGYPALMVTDTGPFRYPQYHRPSDTPDRLEMDYFSRAVEGLDHALSVLTGG